MSTLTIERGGAINFGEIGLSQTNNLGDPGAGGGLIKRGELIGQRSLPEEISHFRRNWKNEDLPYNWYEMPGTGFQVKNQMGFLTSELSQTDKWQDRNSKVKHWLEETTADIRGFTIEYLAEKLVFPIYYKLEDRDGKSRMVNTLHGGGKLLVDTISAKERHGVVKETIAEKIEPFLTQAADGSVAVMVSPAGWSGFIDESSGEPIVYPDSQTYIWQKRGNDIVGFTVRTDFTPSEHRRFVQKISGVELSENSPIEHYISNVGLFPSSSHVEIESVVGMMEEVRVANTPYKERLWDEVYSDIRKGDQLWHYSERSEDLIAEFRNYALEGELTVDQLQEALAATLLRISKLVITDSETQLITVSESNLRVYPEEFFDGNYQDYVIRSAIKAEMSYGNILKAVQEIPGCAGGGIKSGSPIWGMSGLGARRGIVESKVLATNEFRCPACQAVNDVPSDGPRKNCTTCGSGSVYCETK